MSAAISSRPPLACSLLNSRKAMPPHGRAEGNFDGDDPGTRRAVSDSAGKASTVGAVHPSGPARRALRGTARGSASPSTGQAFFRLPAVPRPVERTFIGREKNRVSPSPG